MILNLPRGSGVLLHPTSLPGRWGIGEIGPEALRWLETLRDAGQTYWQILPFGPTGFGNSPYQSLSSFAGNPLWISLDRLVSDGLLTAAELHGVPAFEAGKVDFSAVEAYKPGLLRAACERFRGQMARSVSVRNAFDSYVREEDWWLDDFALFGSIRAEQAGRPWNQWPEPLRDRHPEALAEIYAGLSEEMENAKILQFLFHRQWTAIRTKAAELGVLIIGDIPIFVAHDSADVWSRQELFRLDDKGDAPFVAGVPPDYFNADGQRWGNPLYNWDKHREEGFAWWIKRIEHTLGKVDLVRMDHFRGFAQFWEIPAEDPTARSGHWVDAPGYELFDSVRAALGDLPLIAEDLGVITDDVVRLREHFNLPGMRVLQFAFGTDSLAEQYLPENFPENSIAYTGTHDNDTTMGFFHAAAGEGNTMSEAEIEAQRHTTLNYTGTDGHALNWDFIALVADSASRLALWPLQDALGLGTETRMNLPGTVGESNWTWRFDWIEFTPDVTANLREIALKSGRAGKLEGQSFA